MMAGTIQLLLLAVFAQVALTIGLLVWLGTARVRSAGRREVSIADVALSSSAWPDRLRQIGNAYGNQLEVPVLFYVAAVLAIVMHVVDGVVVALAWAFVILRLVHAYIHVTHNTVIRRFQVFAAGVGAISILWIYLAIRTLMAGGGG